MSNSNIIESIYPLSPMQSGLLFHALYSPKSDAYFIQNIFDLAGEIDVEILKLAWQKISDHYPILRTGLVWQDGEVPEQYVLEKAFVPFVKYDWQDSTREAQQEKLKVFIQEDRKKGFNLSQAPLFRITFIQCSKDRSHLIWSQHHVLLDGWCLSIVLGDVFKTYETLKQGKEVKLIPSRPYRDYIMWLQQQDMSHSEIFWKKYLSNLKGPTCFSFKDIIDKDVDINNYTYTDDYSSYEAMFSPEETEHIKQFAQKYNLTLNTVMQGAVSILLMNYTQQSEIVFGITVSGRNIDLPDIEKMVGLFINTLPLRIQIQPDQNILSFLADLQAQTQTLNDYAYTPLAHIQSWAGVKKRLFDVFFVFQNYPIDESILKESSFKINTERSVEKIEYPLSILIGARQNLYLLLSYKTEHFNRTIIERLCNHIKQILHYITGYKKEVNVYDPHFLHNLSILTSQEKHQLLIEWNDTTTEYSQDRDKCIHELFEEQVAQAPNNIAVVYEGQELTYQELNEKSNQLAHYLRSLGVGPDTLVAIAVERSIEMIVGILGILKAGGAYVPLDPSYPKERLQFILEDTKAHILITQIRFQDLFSHYRGKVIILDDPYQTGYLTQQNSNNAVSLILPFHLAYVIYTSGSTGKPKGVMINHSSIYERLLSLKNIYRVSDKDNFLHHASYSFDASLEEIFLPLIIRAKLIITPQKIHENINGLIEIINSKKITTISLTPSLLEILLENIKLNKLDFKSNKIERIISGGEKLNINHICSFYNYLDITLYNTYGPTETTIECCVFKVERDNHLDLDSVPIGRPISNTQIYILDDYMNPVPIGVSGEIYIGGEGLARGYLNRFELTADRFVPNPFVEAEDYEKSKNLRLYRSGDLARYLPDGNIEFLGRIDDQVKIRGFRIELGEIEAVLDSHGKVSRSIVLAREEELEHKYLVVYVRPQDEVIAMLQPLATLESASDQSFSVLSGEYLPSLTEDLRNYLGKSVPDYMIPASFVYVNDFPLTLNGKIDRKALPAPDLSLRMVETQYVAPITPLEQELCAIWADVLKVETIGIHDDFFKLGGHSLLATQVISRIRHNYNIEIPLRILFEQPTIRSLRQMIQPLIEETTGGSLPMIERRVKPKCIPLSFAQQRLWFLDQLLPEVALYNVPLAMRLKGTINLSALKVALDVLIKRHESLRTIFAVEEGAAYQTILPNISIDLKANTVDLSSLSPEEQSEKLRIYGQQEANTLFDLSLGPLIRVKLIILNKEEHVLLITLHHIISDGWSMGVFFKEFSILYNGYCIGEEVPGTLLAPLPIQYADFALWQREWLQGERLEQQLAYWKEKLSGVPDVLQLPTDRRRPKELSYNGNVYHCNLSRETREQLNNLSQRYQTSLFMTLLAVFQVLLYRYTRQEDIVVGSPIANRHYKEIEGLIGFFVNTLALRTKFTGEETFIDILHSVKETTLQAYQHQDVPFEQLVEHLNISRELNRNPLFQVMFEFQNTNEEQSLNLNNIQVKWLDSDYLVAKFDLSISVHEHEEGIELYFEYATDLFDLETIERFANHFKELVWAISKEPSQLILTYPLLTEREQQQLLIKWNDTTTEYSQDRDKCIHELFEEQVSRAPNNIAVVYEGQELTYQELNEKSNQLAHYLRSLGVGPDTLVAIAVERSIEMIVGILGILKAGGAYVPLDPSYPKERLQFILEDINASVLIIQNHVRDKCQGLFSDYEGKVITLDNPYEIEYLSKQSLKNTISLILPFHLAYVIYTSGSTGKPKGVMLGHKGLCWKLLDLKKTYGLSSVDSFLQYTSFSFDVSIEEIFLPLISGMKIFILPEKIDIFSDEIINFINNKKINTINFTPSLLKHLMHSSSHSLYSIIDSDKIIIGGEVFSVNLLAEGFEKKDIWNLYGPTETTIDSLVFRLKDAKGIKNFNTVPIGRPISNTQIYILDDYMNPVPIGVSGEIYIGGEGLARGYLNRFELTADRFVPNPFVEAEDYEKSKNLRLYRSGDLARYLPDGNIEFLGRIDDQVKIRGFRIELGEIEAVLDSHGKVSRSIVLAREEELEHKYLVVYVRPQDEVIAMLQPLATLESASDQSFSVLSGEYLPSLTEDLRNYLGKSVPDYMIPASFVYVNDFPLTLNGKIDRKALPAPDLSLRMVETQYVAPITPLEQELCAIWADVLKVETIGIHDDFFKLGGHSLLATQVISRIRHNYNIEIPLKELFRSPTISALARTIDVLRKEKVNSSLLSIFAVERKEHSPLSFAQQRLWFLDQLLPEVALYNMPLAMRLKGTINLSALKVALDVLIKRHESLRTIFAVEEGAAYQTILPNISIDLKANTVDLSSLSPEEQSEKLRIYGQQEANTLFDLSLGPLIRVKLIILNKEEHVLLITLHHIISDGWSMGVFFKEFSILYNGYCIGEEVPGTLLAPLPIQYADFALWQREWLQGERLEQQLAYWKEKLSGVPDVLQLPTDRRRPKELSYNGNVYHCNLSRETREQLNNLSQRYQTSLFMTLLAVFQVLLYRYTRQEDIVVGSPIANRHYKEIEGLIGFFVNTLALRTKFTGEETFIDILHSVKETTLQAYQHQDVPFEQLVEHLNISRELNRNPLFQVMFALQNAGEEESLHLNNIQVEWLDSDYLVAKFDLRVSANEHEEGIELYFEYATDLFNLETIERFANHFKELVWAISKEPSQLILTYPLLTEREQQQLLIEWNDTTTEYSQDRDKCIHELFEEQVSRAPNNIAVVYEGQELTYQELNEKSNQLAHYLRSLGVGPDTLVAIAVERSIEMIVGILGILKAGGAYVPLDPSYPKERLQFILEDTSVPIILTNTKIIDSIPSIFARIICLDDDELPDNFDNLPRGSHNSYLAYVSYTSGSTGKPKGVMIPHRSLVNYTGVILKKLTMDYPLRFAYISTFSADLGNTCLYPALLSGSELHILEEKYAFDSNLLSCYFTKYKIDVLKIVPSHLNLLLIESEITEILPRRYLFLGGENFKKDISENIKNYTFLPEIFNHYGPTETTVGCCVFKVERDNHLDLDSVPIGRPISNTQIYILDDYMNPVPIGVSGEIYIGGEGLARGYLNRFELTADRFVPNPFVEAEDYEKSKNLRLYRSGDLARYLPDGNIEFLGRIDDQVKIRGFRIELGEIEAVLDSHGKVSRSIVLAREEELEHKYLVVYVRPQDEVIAMLQPLATLESASDQSFSVLSGEYLPSLTEDLRNYLGKSVPDYMIPASFVYVNDFPLTLNGKIDRKALPAPDLSLRMVETQYVAPITPLEQELCAIWADVLKVETIGIHDDFFKLGGHSLLATQVISRIRHNYNIEIPLRILFEQPTIRSLRQMIQPLIEETTGGSLPMIERRVKPKCIPLSFAQQRLWFLDQLLPEVALYNVPLAMRLKGTINLSALKVALDVLIKRHESLRTIFAVEEGAAYQTILPNISIDLKANTVDLSSLSPEEQSEKLRIYGQQEANTLFDLSLGPLIRVKLIILNKEEHVLLITLHHIISDGWSMGVFFKEFSILYNGYCIGEEVPGTLLAPLPIQYADFALWQREWLQGERLEQQLAYWKEKLSGVPDVLQLPTDRRRPKELSYNGNVYHCNLSRETREQLNNLSQRYQTSLFMTLLAVFQVLLYRYTRQEDIVVGSPIANRHYKEIEGLIGFFVNTLALRTKFTGEETFIDILHSVKETTLQAYQHQDVPFEQLVEHLNISRELNRNPLFQVMFEFQNTNEEQSLNLNNIQVEWLDSDYLVAKFDLSISVHEHEEGIELYFEYATDLFDLETIERFANHFKELVWAISKEPSQLILTYPLLTEREQQQLLIEWNDTTTEYSQDRDKCIHELFEEQVSRAPNNIAVVYEGQELTYQELNEKSNQLAHYLRSLGVGPDTLVAIAVERSIEMIVGILGILKAGGAYVPLDPSYPKERLQFILEDTSVPIILTNTKIIDSIPSIFVRIICLDEEWDYINTLPASNLLSVNFPFYIAYVIYTSGSTGKPKGVLINHGNLAHYLNYAKKTYFINQQTITLFHSSIAFDMSITSLFLPLIIGDIIHILTDTLEIDPIEKILKDFNKFNLLKLTPTHLRALHKEDKFDQVTNKERCLVIGGENLLKNDVSFLLSNGSFITSIFNEYGPTETTVGCCVFKVERDNHLDLDSVPIGRPISNTQIYILDDYMNPVPIGVSGEIYIGGEGLARGYLNRFELTADRFVPNPFVEAEDYEKSKNLRLYRSGDLARYLPDGNIEFLGRIDDQVKIRGFRIELGEIEAVLDSHGKVSRSIVLAREEELEHKYLVVYVRPQDEVIAMLQPLATLESASDQSFSVLSGEYLPSLTEDLRNYLGKSVPDYMIPASFVYVNDFPLTLNGKIDRKALPAPDLSLRMVETQYVAPITPLEQELCAIWADVLKVETIGIHDDFFKLGGHSLLATQVISRIRHNYNIEIPLRILFEQPTIRSLRQMIQPLIEETTGGSLPMIERRVKPKCIPLSFAQQRLWFLDQLLPEVALYNVPLAMRLKGTINLSALKVALDVLIKRHESLRTIFAVEEGAAYQTILPNISIDLKANTVDLSSLSPEEQSEKLRIYGQQEANTLFDLSLGPLIRVKLIILNKEEHVLLITLHHIISDGWSMGVFFKEFSILYNGYCIGEEVPGTLLAPLPIQYADFALWQREWLQGERLEQQLAYWKEKLSGVPDVLQLPTDRRRPKELSYNGNVYHCNLSRETREQLNNLSQRYQTSLFMTLLAVFQVLLYRYTRQEDIVVGSPIANRHYKEIEGLIGFFVNTLALRTKFTGEETFIDILHSVKETTLQAYQHQDVPFEQLVEHLNISRELNRNPLFQVMFGLQNTGEGSCSLDGIQIEQLTPDYFVAKFDLRVSANEHEEGIELYFEYATDLFDLETIERFARHFEQLIKNVLEDPTQKVHVFCILSESETEQLLFRWNDMTENYLDE